MIYQKSQKTLNKETLIFTQHFQSILFFRINLKKNTIVVQCLLSQPIIFGTAHSQDRPLFTQTDLSQTLTQILWAFLLFPNRFFKFLRSLKIPHLSKNRSFPFQKSIHKEIIKLDKLLFKLHFSFFQMTGFIIEVNWISPL